LSDSNPIPVTLNNSNELAVISALSKGSDEAFAFIYNRYWKTLYVTAMQRVQDEDQAKDIVQDVFVRLWEQREQLEINNLKAYLQTAVRNRVLNLVARKKVNDNYYKYLAGFSDVQSGPDEILRWEELLNRFTIMLARMPEKRREIFQLRFEEDMSTKHIANKLNITQKTVQNQLIKAVQYLKEALSVMLLFVSGAFVSFIFLFK
jgi:RNA polymerase sigma-70 factor (family 1)